MTLFIKSKNDSLWINYVFKSYKTSLASNHVYYVNNLQSSAVKVSNITYNKVTGTSSEKTAIDFVCSESLPCKEILVDDVNIQYTGHGSNTSAYCQNAVGAQKGFVFPSTIGCLESNTDP